MKLVRSMAMKKERTVTWCLCECALVVNSQTKMTRRGMPPPYRNIIAVVC